MKRRGQQHGSVIGIMEDLGFAPQIGHINLMGMAPV
jgi:hypothetical protein